MSELAISMNPAELKEQVKQLKGDLKVWEHAFNKEHGRKPLKEDILQDKNIAKKYKQYSKLKSRAADGGDTAGLGDSEMNGSTDLLPATMAREDQTKNGLNPAPAMRGRGVSEGFRDETKPRPAKNGLDLATDVSYNKKAKNQVDSVITEVPMSADSEENLDDVTILPEVLAKPPITFKSTHPLLKDLSSKDVPGAVATITKAAGKIRDVDIFHRVPKGSVLRCKLIRSNEGQDKIYPTYTLINEADDKFIMCARKRKKTARTTFLISNNADDLTKSSNSYVGKVKAHSNNTSYVAYDARTYSPTHADKGLHEMVGIDYSRGITPRQMKVATRPTSIAEHAGTIEKFSEDILKDAANSAKNVLLLKNKEPTFNEATQKHTMNFNGRVKLPSVKNFQLCLDNDPTGVFQFGRVTENSFVMDVVYPLSPIEAFAIALTAFDAFSSN